MCLFYWFVTTKIRAAMLQLNVLREWKYNSETRGRLHEGEGDACATSTPDCKADHPTPVEFKIIGGYSKDRQGMCTALHHE